MRFGNYTLNCALLDSLECRRLLSAVFSEHWNSAAIREYVPTEEGTFIDGDAGTWLVGDTISNFPEDGPTPQRAYIETSSNRRLRLKSVDSDTDSADNIWVTFPFHILNQSSEVRVTAGTQIRFDESGTLESPEKGSANNIPPGGDTNYLAIEDTDGNLLVYIFQRASNRPAYQPPNASNYYREILLDRTGGSFLRDLHADFSTIPNFNTGAELRSITFACEDHGQATLDTLEIGTSLTAASGNEHARIVDRVLRITGTDGEDEIYLYSAGDDVLVSGTEPDFAETFLCSSFDSIAVDLGDSSDWFAVTGDVGPLTADCGAGNDTFLGGDAAETINAGSGRDYVLAGAGNDLINGGAGADTLAGGAGKDKVYGSSDDDRLNGNGGHDRLYGQAGNDRLYGGDGDDYQDGGGNVDRLWGGTGKDTLLGGSSNDKLYGEGGNDLLKGDAGIDLLHGGPGTDRAIGIDDEENPISIEILS